MRDAIAIAVAAATVLVAVAAPASAGHNRLSDREVERYVERRCGEEPTDERPPNRPRELLKAWQEARKEYQECRRKAIRALHEREQPNPSPNRG
ncbi:MAG TPA: hypothetical protein VHL98_13705 [Microvirga sp.]|jgi:hypothetical protein|nr:hypothetical protein [Microvirga sp.]